MAVLVGLLRFLNVFSAGIAAGTFVLVLLALIPIVGRLTPSTGLAVHQALDPLVDRYNPAAVITAILALRHGMVAVCGHTVLSGKWGSGGANSQRRCGPASAYNRQFPVPTYGYQPLTECSRLADHGRRAGDHPVGRALPEGRLTRTGVEVAPEGSRAGGQGSRRAQDRIVK